MQLTVVDQVEGDGSDRENAAGGDIWPVEGQRITRRATSSTLMGLEGMGSIDDEPPMRPGCLDRGRDTALKDLIESRQTANAATRSPPIQSKLNACRDPRFPDPESSMTVSYSR